MYLRTTDVPFVLKENIATSDIIKLRITNVFQELRTAGRLYPRHGSCKILPQLNTNTAFSTNIGNCVKSTCLIMMYQQIYNPKRPIYYSGLSLEMRVLFLLQVLSRIICPDGPLYSCVSFH